MENRKTPDPGPQRLTFRNRSAFRAWLQKNCSRQGGIWLVLGKNNAVPTLTAEEALEEALCFGWIDGLIKRVDEKCYVKFFSPRRSKSRWSDKNKAAAEKLIRNCLMAPPGLEAVDRAKQDGTWKTQQRPIVTPGAVEQFAALIAANVRAAANFQNMPFSVKKLYTGYYLDAKQEETRRRRLAKLLPLLEQNKRPML